MTSEKTFHFIVPVWGTSYTALFTEVCLPMLLTPGNLGAMNHERDRFVIVTTWSDSKSIRSSEFFPCLEAQIKVDIILIDGLVDTTNAHAAMSRCYRMAMLMDTVRPGTTNYVFLTPDSFWSEGTFATLVDLASRGIEVVMVAGLRVEAERAAAQLRQHLRRAPNDPTMPRDELVRFVLSNLHQLSKAHNWLSRDRFLNAWPSHIYWIDERNEQLVAHCFHMHPIMVLAGPRETPIGTTIDGDFLDKLDIPIERFHVVQDEFIGVELSPAERNWGQPLGVPLIGAVRRFALLHANSRHWHFFRKRVLIRADTTRQANPELLRLADTVVAQVLPYERFAQIVQRYRLARLLHWLVRPEHRRTREIVRRLLRV